jgi:oligosaccharide repeat unit polymerase
MTTVGGRFGNNPLPKQATPTSASHPRDRRRGLVPSIAFFLLTVGVAPLFFVGQIASVMPVDATTAFVQWLLIAYSGTHLARIVFVGEPNWLDLSLYGYIYTWLALAPFIQLFAGENPLKIAVGPNQLQAQAVIVLCGLIAFDLGALWARQRGQKDDLYSAEPAGTRQTAPVWALDRRRVTLLALVSLALTPFFINALGGLGSLFASRDARYETLQTAGLYTEESKGGGAWLSSIASVLPFLSLYALIVLLIMMPTLRKIALLWALLALSVVANLILNNPISSSRFWFLVVMLSIVYVTAWAQRPGGVRVIATLFVGGSVVLFPYLDLFRNGNATLQVRSVTAFFTQKTDYDSLVQVGNSWALVQSYGIDVGRQMSGVVAFFVPRSFWPNKPIDTGSVLARYINYPNENLSAPLWGEFYVNFGISGVILGFGLAGYFAQKATHRYLVALSRSAVSHTIYLSVFMYPVLAVYFVLILRGSLLQAMGKLVVLVAVMLIFTARRPALENRATIKEMKTA